MLKLYVIKYRLFLEQQTFVFRTIFRGNAITLKKMFLLFSLLDTDNTFEKGGGQLKVPSNVFTISKLLCAEQYLEVMCLQ
jgi:hypothetical protein